MAIVRTPKKKRYAAISNLLLQDETISFGCRGMMGYLLSKPDNWEVRPIDIEKAGNIGRDARRALMVEAERAGYLTFHTGRAKGGQFESWYNAHEEPVPKEERTRSWETGKKRASPDTGNPYPADPYPADPYPAKPGPGNPGAGKPGTANRGGLKNKEVPITDKNKTKKTKSPASAGKGGQQRPEGQSKPTPVEDKNWVNPFVRIFDEEFQRVWKAPYMFSDTRDFGAVKVARNTYQELFTEEIWRTACRNYMDSPPRRCGHKIWDLVDRFAMYLKGRTDRFGHLIEDKSNDNGANKQNQLPAKGSDRAGEDLSQIGGKVKWRVNVT